MVVLYYTSPHFLDVAIETIQAIKPRVDLHVVIEISPFSRKSTVVNVPALDHLDTIEDCETVLGSEQWNRIKNYFTGVKSVKFVVHKNPKSFSYDSYSVAKKIGKYISVLSPDVVHFDSITARCIGLYRYIRSKKIFITIHDPLPHSGEQSWKRKIPDFLFFRRASGYVFYSEFARSQFIKAYREITAPTYVIRFQPFTSLSRFMPQHESQPKSILFFGRLSPYKGIDLLLEAIPLVLEKYPDEKFVIAGAPDFDYKVNMQPVSRYSANIELVQKYLSAEELMEKLQQAKFVVCPYRDATQSGVLMTSFAAGKTVVATSVGAFPEYIENHVNGLLTEPTAKSIANGIMNALSNDSFKVLEQNVPSSYSPETGDYNGNQLLMAYKSASMVMSGDLNVG